MNYSFYISVLQGHGSVNELIFHARGLIAQEEQKDHRSDGRTTWHSDFSADQLVGHLGSWTSSPTSWLNCSALTSTQRSVHSQQVGWAAL